MHQELVRHWSRNRDKERIVVLPGVGTTAIVLLAESNSLMEPVVGEIYITRASVRKAIQTAKSRIRSSSSSASSVSGSTSSASSHLATGSSKFRDELRQKRRPCLFWNKEGTDFIVLVFTKFDCKDLSEVQDLDETLLPKLSEEELLKIVVPIHPTPSLPDREAIVLEEMTSSANAGSFELTGNQYLILQPIRVEDNSKRTGPLKERVSTDGLLYLNRLIGELAQEKISLAQEKISLAQKQQEEIILNRAGNSALPTDETNDSPSSSSLPIARGAEASFCDVRRNSNNASRCSDDRLVIQNERIHNWLQNCVVDIGENSQLQQI